MLKEIRDCVNSLTQFFFLDSTMCDDVEKCSICQKPLDPLTFEIITFEESTLFVCPDCQHAVVNDIVPLVITKQQSVQ